ncbi:MAG: FAD-binding oxidoreductase [Hyphomicrobiaceae bacterium]|nr:FAD-binding oxidoreductase [Hyphomicrobiaceae bacterium]
MPSRIYHPDLYRFANPPRHYWRLAAGTSVGTPALPLAADLDVDVAVIGAGYAGLSAALRLAGRHGVSVAVLDAAATIGWGASGMNGGFVSMGGVKLELAELVARVGEAETRRYWTSQIDAVEALRGLIETNAIACEPTGDGNFCVAHHPKAAEGLRAEVEALTRRFGVAADYVEAGRFRAEIHDGPETFGALRLRPSFGMQPSLLVDGMARAAARAGARLHVGAEVVAWRREAGRHRLITAAGASVRAGRVIVATNGYAANGLEPRLDYRAMPAVSSIVVTQPWSPATHAARGFHSLAPIYNSRHLLSYYRRLPDGRILFGMRGDTSGSDGAQDAQAERTVKALRRALPAYADAEIAHAWRGLVCLTGRFTLSLGLLPDEPSVAFAFGCHGSGTATMTWAGSRAADLVMGAAREDDIPALLRGLAPRLPPNRLALRLGLKAAYGLYRVKDALGL